MDNVAIHTELVGDRGLRDLLPQQVFEKHDFIPSVDGASAGSRRGTT